MVNTLVTVEIVGALRTIAHWKPFDCYVTTVVPPNCESGGTAV